MDNKDKNSEKKAINEDNSNKPNGVMEKIADIGNANIASIGKILDTSQGNSVKMKLLK